MMIQVLLSVFIQAILVLPSKYLSISMSKDCSPQLVLLRLM
ncbi:hypothetical protein TRIP_E230094 [uncultured Spirochaetota bacterium]|nr:hypothetical protein TRIP_E230094 [uncultured Spirochaetota bacterium]